MPSCRSIGNTSENVAFGQPRLTQPSIVYQLSCPTEDQFSNLLDLVTGEVIRREVCIL